ncbi:MAG TPA: hypothetical protein VLL77_05195 [Anaerolineales bacterium]|nr:hypothetical protein [Anaerolineales bacterium]
MAKPVVDRSDRQPPDAESLRALVRQKPDDPAAHRQLGWGLYGAQAFTEALDAFEQAVRSFPDDDDLLYGLALTAKKLNKAEMAADTFAKAAARAETIDDPGRSEILHRLAAGHQNYIRTGGWGLKRQIWGEA